LDAFKGGRSDEAGRLCLAVLADDPASLAALLLLASVQVRRGFHLEALACCDRALQIEPSHPEGLLQRGEALVKLKRHDEALADFDSALAVRPDWAEALNERGLVLHALERYDEALQSYARALSIRPNFAGAHCNRGRAHLAVEKFAEALIDFSSALRIDPHDADALNNRALLRSKMWLYRQALDDHDKACALRPDSADVINNRGATLLDMFRFDEALVAFDRALAIQPDFVEALNNRGNVLRFTRRYDEALASYDRALAIDPDYPEAHFNRDQCRRTLGDYAAGFVKHDFRLKPGKFAYATRDLSGSLWLGEQDIAGKTILIYARQGLGDTILFCRYVRLVAEQGAKVILQAQEALKRLLSRMRAAHLVLAHGEPLPPFDFHCALDDLPIAFGTTLATVPEMRPPLGAPSELIEAWQSRLGPKTRPRVGLVCSGNQAQLNDPNRSMPLATLTPLFALPLQFVCLQQEIRDRDRLILSAHAANLTFFGLQLTDFLDTAALASLMDLVVTVDSSVANLSGALGLPTWVLLSYLTDGRWLDGRTDSPWYPTIRLFQQERLGDWDPVIAKVLAQLEKWGSTHAFLPTTDRAAIARDQT
jgi:tetratricopeptide (TPR) repeat protein